jgi:hypothetical protein
MEEMEIRELWFVWDMAEMLTAFKWKNLEERVCLDDILVRVDGRLLKWI